MLEYYEVNPLPEVCIRCIANDNEDEDCYNCDYTLERWHLTPDSERRLDELLSERRNGDYDSNPNRRRHDYK